MIVPVAALAASMAVTAPATADLVDVEGLKCPQVRLKLPAS